MRDNLSWTSDHSMKMYGIGWEVGNRPRLRRAWHSWPCKEISAIIPAPWQLIPSRENLNIHFNDECGRMNSLKQVFHCDRVGRGTQNLLFPNLKKKDLLTLKVRFILLVTDKLHDNTITSLHPLFEETANFQGLCGSPGFWGSPQDSLGTVAQTRC